MKTEIDKEENENILAKVFIRSTSPWKDRMRHKSIFKLSTDGLNSEFSFS